MITVWWPAACPITAAFSIPEKPLHRDVCSGDQWDALETAATCSQRQSQTGLSSPQQPPTMCGTTSTSKVERIGLRNLTSSTIFTWPPANQLPLLQASQQLFAEKMLPHSAGGRKCFPRGLQISEHGFLCCRSKQTYLSLAKLLIVVVPILINKDVFEPSCNDLKFVVWNHNYFFTSLIVCPE